MSAPSDDFLKQRDAAYFDALLRAFIEIRRERDKTLLALSTGGIGLLVTLQTAFGLGSCGSRALYFSAVALFLVTIVATLFLFGEDARYVETILRERTATAVERRLRCLDKVAFGSFLSAMIFAVAFGVSQTSAQPTPRGEVMSEKARVEKSLTGLADLRPGADKPSPTSPSAPAAVPATGAGEAPAPAATSQPAADE